MSQIAGVSPAQAARTFRQEHGLGFTPISDLVEVLEQIPHLHVAIERSAESSVHGVRVHDPGRNVTVIGATASPVYVRLRSTLAHELGHHLFNDPTPATLTESSPEEVRARDFARHLLLPTDALSEFLGTPGKSQVTMETLSRLVQRFGVSPTLAAWQLFECQYIDAETKSRFSSLETRHLAIRFGWSALYDQQCAQAVVPRPPQKLIAMAVDAYARSEMSLATLAHLQGEDVTKVHALLESAGIRPQLRPDLQTAPEAFDPYGELDAD